MCSREVLASHSALRLAELEQTTVGLHQVNTQYQVYKVKNKLPSHFFNNINTS